MTLSSVGFSTPAALYVHVMMSQRARGMPKVRLRPDDSDFVDGRLRGSEEASDL